MLSFLDGISVGKRIVYLFNNNVLDSDGLEELFLNIYLIFFPVSLILYSSLEAIQTAISHVLLAANKSHSINSPMYQPP